MIESLFNPKEVKEKGTKRLEIFIAGIIFTLIGALFAINVVPPTPEARGLGFLVVAFISIPAAPFFVQLFKLEEKEDIVEKEESIIFRHIDIIEIFAFFFLAVLIASSFFYVIAPPEVSESVFNDQVNDLVAKRVITGKVVGPSPDIAERSPEFWSLISNNTVVLVLSFAFSLVMGAGAIFLISWNASVIGVLIGKIAENPGAFGSVSTGNILTNYLIALPVTILRLLPHGVFEIGSYFIGAVAGGILSAGIIQESIRHRKTEFSHLKKVLIDSLFYLGVAVLFLFIGAVIECFIV